MNIEILYVYLHCPRNDLEQSSSRARCCYQVQTPQPFNHLEKSLSFRLWQGLGMPLRYLQEVPLNGYLHKMPLSRYIQGMSLSRYLQWMPLSRYLQRMSLSRYIQGVLYEVI